MRIILLPVTFALFACNGAGTNTNSLAPALALTSAGKELAKTQNFAFSVTLPTSSSIHFDNLSGVKEFTTLSHQRDPVQISVTQGQSGTSVYANYTLSSLKKVDILVIVGLLHGNSVDLSQLNNLAANFDSTTDWQIKFIPALPPTDLGQLSLNLGAASPQTFAICGSGTDQFLFRGKGPIDSATSARLSNFTTVLTAAINAQPSSSIAIAPVYAAFLGLTCDVTSRETSQSSDFWLRPDSNLELLFITDTDDCANQPIGACSFDISASLAPFTSILGSNIGNAKTSQGLEKLLQQAPLPFSEIPQPALRTFSNDLPMLIHTRVFAITAPLQSSYYANTSVSPATGLGPDSGGSQLMTTASDYSPLFSAMIADLSSATIAKLPMTQLSISSVVPQSPCRGKISDCMALAYPDAGSVQVTPNYLSYDAASNAIVTASAPAGQQISVNYRIGATSMISQIPLKIAPDLASITLSVKILGTTTPQNWVLGTDFSHLFQNGQHFIVFDKKPLPELATATLRYLPDTDLSGDYYLPELPLKIVSASLAGTDIASSNYSLSNNVVSFHPPLAESQPLAIAYASTMTPQNGSITVNIGIPFSSLSVKPDKGCEKLTTDVADDHSSVTIACKDNPNLAGTITLQPLIQDQKFPLPEQLEGLAKYYDFNCYLTGVPLDAKNWTIDDQFATLKAQALQKLKSDSTFSCVGAAKAIVE